MTYDIINKISLINTYFSGSGNKTDFLESIS